MTGRAEPRIHYLTRGLCFGAIVGCVFNICLYAVILPAWLPLLATVSVVITVLVLLGVRRQARHARRIRRVWPCVSIQPEVGLPPGFVPPSATLTPPASNPPMSALTVLMSRAGITVLSLDGHLARCTHPDVVPVDQPDVIGGARVAWLCANAECGAQLPADWPG